RQVADYLFRRGVSREMVDECLSEVYVTAWRRIEEVPVDANEAVYWLCGVARRLLSRAWRARHRHAALAERCASELVTQDQRQAPSVDERYLLVEAWHALAPSDREVLSIAGLTARSTEDLALRLSCSPGAAAARLSRARSRMNRQIGL
ncbi:MAG: RNA polymerase sigma factor, partial [Longimicrobiales bacterium]